MFFSSKERVLFTSIRLSSLFNTNDRGREITCYAFFIHKTPNTFRIALKVILLALGVLQVEKPIEGVIIILAY